MVKCSWGVQLSLHSTLTDRLVLQISHPKHVSLMLSGSWVMRYLTCPSTAACHQYTARWTWSTISWSEGCWKTIWESLLRTSWDHTTCRTLVPMWETNQSHVDWPTNLRVYCSLCYMSMSTYKTFGIVFSRLCFIPLFSCLPFFHSFFNTFRRALVYNTVVVALLRRC